MDQANKVHVNEPERNAECDSPAGALIALTATLAITGIGLSPVSSEASTITERINAIHIAVQSGVIKPQHISHSEGTFPQGIVMGDFDKISPIDKPRPRPRNQVPIGVFII